MEQLLTKPQLAEHWQVTEKAIENWTKDGLITPCQRVPGRMRFSPRYIAELEGVKLEKHSPLEWRRLERELEQWKIRAEKAENVITQINVATTEVIYCKQKEMEA